MMYDDHDRSRSQVPAEPLFLANSTDPRRDRLIGTNHLKGLIALACSSSGGRDSWPAQASRHMNPYSSGGL
jgi:hypothetical protein